MGPGSKRKCDRIERKKRSLAALLNVSELNAKDRIKQEVSDFNSNEYEIDKNDNSIASNMRGVLRKANEDGSPIKKRIKTEDDTTSSPIIKVECKVEIEDYYEVGRIYEEEMDVKDNWIKYEIEEGEIADDYPFPEQIKTEDECPFQRHIKKEIFEDMESPKNKVECKVEIEDYYEVGRIYEEEMDVKDNWIKYEIEEGEIEDDYPFLEQIKTEDECPFQMHIKKEIFEDMESPEDKVECKVEIENFYENDQLNYEEMDVKDNWIKYEIEEGEIEDDYPLLEQIKTEDECPFQMHIKKEVDEVTIPKESPKNDDKTNIHEQQTARDFNMSTEEYMKLKKELRERKNLLKVIPRILLTESGNRASLDSNCKTPIFISDIQHLILYSLLGHHSPVRPRWCDVEKYNRITHTVILIVEGPTVYDVVSQESSCPNFADLKLKVEFLSPFNYDGILVEELAAVPLSRSQMNHLQKKFGSLHKAEQTSGLVFRVLRSIFPMKYADVTAEQAPAPHQQQPISDRFPRTDLLLSAWQMVEEGYPLPLRGELKDRYSDYVMTKDEYSEVTPTSPMWGLDCEMCLTSTRKNELTRISIVDENCKMIYDTLVKPPNKIINYLTQYSGITKEMLKNVTKTLEEVQEDVRNLLPPDVILVGQSLNSDLHAMKMMHPYIIDTSVIFNLSGLRLRKTKLSVLCSTFLNEVIQDSAHGHDSIEDSTSALKLVKLKLENSVEFGDAVLSGPLSYAIDQTKAKHHTTHGNHATNVHENNHRSHLNNQVTHRNLPTTVHRSNLRNNLNKQATHGNPTTNVQQNNHKNKNSKKNDKKDEPEVKHEEILFTSLFSHVLRNEKSAAVIAQKDILENYETFVLAPAFDSTESERRVKSMLVESNGDVIQKTCEETNFQSFVVAHLRLADGETVRDVDRWCGAILKSLAFNSFLMVIFAGREDSDAHGACMLAIKQRPISSFRNSI